MWAMTPLKWKHLQNLCHDIMILPRLQNSRQLFQSINNVLFFVPRLSTKTFNEEYVPVGTMETTSYVLLNI